MKTIQVINENGKLAGTMSVDCKPATKVNKPYFNESFELIIPGGWSEIQLKKWLKSDPGKTAVEANKAAKQAAKQAQNEVSPVILTIVTKEDKIDSNKKPSMKNYTQKKLTERTIDEVGTCKLSQLTKGVFLKVKENANEVYTFAGKDRKYGYLLQSESDINKQRYIKKDVTVVVGFTY